MNGFCRTLSWLVLASLLGGCGSSSSSDGATPDDGKDAERIVGLWEATGSDSDAKASAHARYWFAADRTWGGATRYYVGTSGPTLSCADATMLGGYTLDYSMSGGMLILRRKAEEPAEKPYSFSQNGDVLEAHLLSVAFMKLDRWRRVAGASFPRTCENAFDP
jgi:hypothetical protein